MNSTPTQPSIHHQDLSARADQSAQDWKLDGHPVEPKVEVEPYSVTYDCRRRGRSRTFWRVRVDGRCVAGGLTEREANKQAEAIKKAA